MEDLQQIVTIISAVLGVVATAIGLIIPLVRSVSSKNKLVKFNNLISQVQGYIMEVEKLTNYTGIEKKERVLAKANTYAQKHKIKYDEEVLSQKIDEIVELSTVVNQQNANDTTHPLLENKSTDITHI